jgi:hypothetical protein
LRRIRAFNRFCAHLVWEKADGYNLLEMGNLAVPRTISIGFWTGTSCMSIDSYDATAGRQAAFRTAIGCGRYKFPKIRDDAAIDLRFVGRFHDSENHYFTHRRRAGNLFPRRERTSGSAALASGRKNISIACARLDLQRDDGGTGSVPAGSNR